MSGGLRLLLVLPLTAVASLGGAAGADSVDLHGFARVDGRPAPNAVVWLVSPGTPPSSRTGRAVLDQRNLSFVPRVLAVRVGTTVDFPNNDRVFHNVFSFRDGKRFDLGLYPVGASLRVTFDRPGLSRIFCNIHPSMAAYVMAVESPYFAVSDESGAFTISSVPAGTYPYAAWRPGAEQITGTWVSSRGQQLVVGWP
jgi:plastocyanin